MIKSLSFLIGLIYVCNTLFLLDLLIFIVQNANEIDGEILFYFTPVVLVPVGLYLFMKKTIVGWVMISTLSVVFVVYGASVIYEGNYPSIGVWMLVLFGGILFFLHRPGVTDYIEVSDWSKLISYFIGTIYALYILATY